MSYLFLSQPSVKSAEIAALPGFESAQSVPGPALSGAPILLRAGPAVNREVLLSLLARNTSVLEEGMRAIDTNVPCDPFGSIDVVALSVHNRQIHDRNDFCGRLSIIHIDSVSNDAMLLRGIGQADWMVRNAAIVERMYPGREIDFSAQPRLFLVAPSFSPALKAAAQRVAHPEVCCFEYRTVALAGSTGILFERVRT